MPTNVVPIYEQQVVYTQYVMEADGTGVVEDIVLETESGLPVAFTLRTLQHWYFE